MALDIHRVVDSLNVIDPALSSVDENLAPVPKMGFFKKWCVRLLNFISGGYYAKNSQLDETTNRIYECALRTLPATFEEAAEQRRFINAFTKLQAINNNNEGSGHARIEQLISRIRNISLRAPDPRPAPIPGLPPPQQIPSPKLNLQPPLPPAVAPIKAPVRPQEPQSDPLLQLSTEEILKEIPLLRPDDLRLPALAEKIATDNQSTGALICRYEYSFSMLLSACRDNLRFKVFVAELLLQHKSYFTLQEHFTDEVWEEVAKRWPLEKLVDSFGTPLGVNLEGVVRFVNILAARDDVPNSRKIENIHSLITHLIPAIINKPNFSLIASISPQALSLCKVRNLFWREEILNCDDINVLHTILRPLIEQDENRYFWLDLQKISPEKCKQLPWKEYPRWVQFFLAHRAGQLEDVAHLRKVCTEMTPTEITKAQDFLNSYQPYPFALIKALVDDSLRVQHPFVQHLILKGLEKPDHAITLPQNVWDSLEVQNVNDKNARLQLINALSLPACRIALQAWDDYSPLTHDKDWPFVKFIQGSENPKRLKSVFTAFFDDKNTFGHRAAWRKRIPNGCAEILEGFELNPWKLSAVLYQIHDFEKDNEWVARDFQFPKTCGLVSKYALFTSQAKEFRNNLIMFESSGDPLSEDVEVFTFSHTFRSNPKWMKVYAQKTSEEVSTFVLGFLKNADPTSIALYLPEDDETMLFFAIFDEQARANLIKAMRLSFIRSGEISKAFLTLHNVIKEVSKSTHLPPDATQQAAQFLSQLMGCLNIGGVCCPLSKQFNLPQFSDMTLKIGNETFFVHNAIVELDPLLQSALQENQQTLSKLRLKSLYGTLTPEEWQLPEAKAIMKEHKQLSLAKLANPPAGLGVVTLVAADGQTFRAYRFILAAALGYFEGIFSSGMNEAKKDQIELQDVGGEEMQALLDYVYTDEQPEFEDTDSEEAFKAVLNRFNPTGSAP